MVHNVLYQSQSHLLECLTICEKKKKKKKKTCGKESQQFAARPTPCVYIYGFCFCVTCYCQGTHVVSD